MRIGAASFGSILLGLRNVFIEQAIQGLGDLDASDYHALVIEVAAQDAGQVEALAEEQYLIGAELIAEELQRQQAGLGDAVTQAVEDAAVRLLTSLSRVTVSRLANDVQARVIAAAQQAALLGVEDVPSAVYSSMRDGSTGYVDRAARAMANTSLAAGRKAEIKARPDDIRVVIYSAILDANTCRPCGEADGETGEVDEITPVPNRDCPGGGECRCLHIAVSELSEVEIGPRAPAEPTTPVSPASPASPSESAPETALEARIRLAEIFAEVEQEKAERVARRRELAEQFVAARGRKKKQIEKRIVELDRSEAEIQDIALARYRGVMYQDAPAQFSVARAGQFDARANRNIDEGVEVFARLVGAGKLDGKTVTFYPEIDRSYYDNQGGVHITGTLTNGVIHEIGHWLEDLSPTIHDELLGFYAARTQGDALEKMADLRPGWGYRDAETTKKDRFANAYMGIYYEHDGRQYQTELLSMALQFLYEDPLGFADKDREMFDFIFELLRK